MIQNALRRIPPALTVCMLAACLPAACLPAGAEPPRDGDWLEARIRSARDGEVIEIPAGDYDLTDLAVTKDLALVGPADGAAVLRSAETTDKGGLVPKPGVSVRLENLTFRNTSAWDRNGAGVRHEGRDLTIVNCVFDSNEDGILATGEADGRIVIRDSEFLDNGFGDGQSHAIYVVQAAELVIDDSRFIGTRIGHHVKSLAEKTVIRGSFFDDAYGRSSYMLDASRGGDVLVAGNTIIQSADSDNHAIINYDLSRGGAARGLVIENNRVINRYDGGLLVRNDTALTPVIRNNEVTNEGARPLRQ